MLLVLAKYNRTEARQYALDFLANDQPVMMKTSALVVLGVAGYVEDRAVVKAYTDSPDVRLNEASRAALQRLSR